MARKYDLISELYNRTCKTVVSNPQNWQAFLASACRNYKLRYDEQLLVYAQRPDATAVLEIEQWNKIFGRWVNRGARGIAVFADENRSRQRLTHYFDISDTHESRYSRTVPIWDMRQEYEADVIETLESTFGEIENKSSLAESSFIRMPISVSQDLRIPHIRITSLMWLSEMCHLVIIRYLIQSTTSITSVSTIIFWQKHLTR